MKDNNNKSNITIIFRKLQKSIIIFVFVLSILTFIYALCFSSDVYPLFFHTDPLFWYVKGSEIYFHVQNFNKLLFELAIAQIIVCISMFIFFTHKRRKYYLSNYITSILFSLFSLFLGIFILLKIFDFRKDYLKVDFATYKAIADEFHLRYVKSTFYFDVGIVLAILLIISAILVISNLIIKHIAMKEEAKFSQEPEKKINNIPEVQNG